MSSTEQALGAAPSSEAALPMRPTVWLLRFLDEAPTKLTRYIAAALIVAASTALAEFLYRTFETSRLSPVFLGAVLIAAVTLGRGAAFFAALLAFALYNFYLVEPRFTLQFATAEDFLNIVLFLAVALLTGGLAGRVRDEARKSQARARTMSSLFEASRTLSATESEAVLRDRLSDNLRAAVDGPALVVEVDAAEPDKDELDALEPHDRGHVLTLITAARRPVGGRETLQEGPWRARPIKSGDRRLGTALWRVPEMTERESEELRTLTDVLVDLGGAALARARLSAEKAQIEAVARTEKLRTALLSSISHDFRTPLSGILASATSLMEFDEAFDRETRRDLASNIQEEAERLNRFVANLLNMTKLESGVLEPHLGRVSAPELVASAVERVEKRKGKRRLTIVHVGHDHEVTGDPVLLEQALTNVLENAIAFSPDGSEVSTWITEHDHGVKIEISDEGPGVPPDDLPHIFDKFYRASSTQGTAQGTGLGLSITKGLVEAMGGSVTAGLREDGQSGLSVSLRLPAAGAQ
jgi:two-component system sensor histidine kinase KdpD